MNFYGQTVIADAKGMIHICNCVGPQNGQPLCPCAMRAVKIVNGRYVMPERDLGPARPTPTAPAVTQENHNA